MQSWEGSTPTPAGTPPPLSSRAFVQLFRPISAAVAGATLSCWGAGPPPTMAGELEGAKPLSGLLSGLAQDAFYGYPGITEELLRSQLYPEVPPEEFRPFMAKMKGILKVPLLPAASAAESNLFPAALRLVTPEAERLPSSDLRSRGSWIPCIPSDPLHSLCPFSHFLRAPRSSADRHSPEKTWVLSPDTSLLCRLRFRVASADLCAPYFLKLRAIKLSAFPGRGSVQ